MRGRSWEMNGNSQTGNDVRTLGGGKRTCSSSISASLPKGLACVVFFSFLSIRRQRRKFGLRDDQWISRDPDLGRPDSLKVPPPAGLLGSRVPFVTHLSLSLFSGSGGRGVVLVFCFSGLQALYGLDGRRRHVQNCLLLGLDGVVFQAKRCVGC